MGLVITTGYRSNRHLFRFRGIKHEENMENLSYILSYEENLEATKAKVGQLPSNKDVLSVLQSCNKMIRQSLADNWQFL